MSNYLIIGAGAVGTAAAEQLAALDHHVTIATRSGSGPEHHLVTRVAADATRADRVAQLAEGCAAIFNCANPPYNRWPTDWPPIANALLSAAERSGGVLATTGNLYVYGRVTGPMSPETPELADFEKARVRMKMWSDALDAHNAGRLRATEVRASDFIGPSTQSVVGERVVPKVLAGKSCQVLGRLDQTHSWTYIDDVARTLIACAQQPGAWGRVWHAPTNPPRTQREVINDLADAAGVEHVKVSVVPNAALRVLGLFSPLVRELPKTMYQFTAPFVIDDSSTRTVLGLQPTSWSDVLSETIAAYRK
jgi:nucleoside-diphosphate-sugar epimerase